MIERDFWFGPEVEGRLSGVSSVFVRHAFPAKELTEAIPHFYFTVEFVRARANNSQGWNEVRDIRFSEGKMATIEVDDGCFENVPHDLFNACHIIYRVKARFVERLKRLDTVTLDVRPYNIFCSTVDALMHVEPERYGVDTDAP